jgi:hypothetical protein
MKYLNIFFALMFMAFAFLQVNDPDPALWIIIYGTMAVVSVMAIFESYNRKVLIVLAVFFVGYCIFLLPGVSEWLRQDNLSVLFDEGMKMQYLYVEEAREFLGLVICLLVLILYLFRAFRQKTA